MWYKINVSRDGVHYFATHERSVKTERKAKELYLEFKRAFTVAQGYKVSVTLLRQSGTFVDVTGWE